MPATPQPEKAPKLDGPLLPTLSDADQPRATTAPQPSGASSFVLAEGQRPLPEYELVCKLGAGGFGEVWKAKGPGGFHVALKFVRLEQRAGETELRALELMKDVRHAHLLGIFGTWQRDGLLVIAMELADGTLLDRLRQAQAEGHPGIPRDELQEYLREAAKGLDFLNERRLPAGGTGGPVGIQHKDVKPQNLLLAGGTVKVADFGLAKVLEHSVTAATGGRTPAYAAPEFFNAQATRWSDQYSLAVAYCELRAGRLPFEGTEFQLMAGHVMQPPDLTMLPEAERPAVARALAKKPEERWPSCRAFAEALAEAGRSAPAPAEPTKVVPEGEAPLAQRCREALERAGGKLTPEDRAALSALCRGYGIPAERANAIMRETRVRWAKEHPGHRTGGKTQPATAPPSVARGVQPRPGRRPPASPGARPGPARDRRGSRPLLWLLTVVVPLGGAALVGVVLLAALLGGPASDTRQTSWSITAKPPPPPLPEIVKPVAGTAGEPQPTNPTTRATGPVAGTHPETVIVAPVAGPERGRSFTNSVGMRFAWVEPGSFTMGSPADEPQRGDGETPHRVTLTKGFHLGACLVTQAQWEQVLGKAANHSWFMDRDDDDEKKKLAPVDNVSWFDGVEFCIKLSEREGRKPCYRLTNVTRGADGAIRAADLEVQAGGTGYRLPSEAQWEYAYRAGTQTPFWWGSTITTDQANYDGTNGYGKDGQKGEYRHKTTPVDFFPANPWGLHDMGSNLEQWCEDWYAPYPAGDGIDPLNTKKDSSSYRVLRGGSWWRGPWNCRAAHRTGYAPADRQDHFGCRVVLCLETSSIVKATGPVAGTHPETVIVAPVAGPERGQPFTNSVGMQMAWIKPGNFTMGSPADEPQRANEEETPHRVTLTKGFHLGACLVTQAQWEQVLGKDANHSKFMGKDDDEKKKLPVDNVSWFDGVAFCIKLSEREGRKPCYRLTNVTRGADGAIGAADLEVQAGGTGYRLPSEAQWEYACRAGTQTPFWWGSSITPDQANYEGTSTYGKDGQKGENRQKTTPVDFFPANPWRLHDMGGNLEQWCEDWFAPYPAAEVKDPLNIVKDFHNARVLRGGSWFGYPLNCRAAFRDRIAPAERYGFCGCRVALCLN